VISLSYPLLNDLSGRASSPSCLQRKTSFAQNKIYRKPRIPALLTSCIKSLLSSCTKLVMVLFQTKWLQQMMFVRSTSMSSLGFLGGSLESMGWDDAVMLLTS
jgi:hypothetical protein